MILNLEMNLRIGKRFNSAHAITRNVLERVFKEISQNLQENTCARVSFFIKLRQSCHYIETSRLIDWFLYDDNFDV